MKNIVSLLARAEERPAFQKVIFHTVSRFVVSKVTRAMAKYGPAKPVAVSGCKVRVGT